MTFFLFKQKTAYEVRISDWSSDVCSSDLPLSRASRGRRPDGRQIVPAASLTQLIASTARPLYDAAMTDIQTARHLAAITREAAARAYEADAGTSGKIAVWFMTVLTTLHAGGLLAALQYSEKLAMHYATQCSLLSGLLATLEIGSASRRERV